MLSGIINSKIFLKGSNDWTKKPRSRLRNHTKNILFLSGKASACSSIITLELVNIGKICPFSACCMERTSPFPTDFAFFPDLKAIYLLTGKCH